MRAGRQDERRVRIRQSRVVLMPRRWHLAIMLCMTPTVTTKPDHRGERGISRQTIRVRECRVAGVLVVTLLACFFHLHARLRVRRAPGIPHALCSGRKVFLVSAWVHLHRGEARVCLFSVVIPGRA